MSDDAVSQIVRCMRLYGGNSSIQYVQTAHRLRLADFWEIKPGERILEIGCGQGDTTAALAYLVGEEGLVYGIDNASADYGSPITLGQAAAHLKQSALGKQIAMNFATDFLSPEVTFPDHFFDKIVLSHCSWYLQSFEELQKILQKAAPWAKTLCFAEWDAHIKTMEQLPHFLAILIQSQYEAFKESSSANVRTLLTPHDARRAAELAGWHIAKEESIHSADLQDGKWECEMVLADYQQELDRLQNVPAKFKSLIHSQAKLLQELTDGKLDVHPLSTYAFVATKE